MSTSILLRPVFLIGLAIILLCSYSVRAADKLLDFACNNFPPQKIERPDQSGLPGYDVEILKAAFAEGGYRVKTRYYPWNRALHLAQRGAVTGLCSCSFRPEREEYLIYSDEMGTVSNGVFSVDRPPAVKSLSDLKGRSVGVVSGYSLENALDDAKAMPVVATNIETAVRMLFAKRFDYLYNFRAATDYYLKDMPGAQRVSYQEFERSPYYLCVSNRYPGAKGIINDFNEGLATIRRDGTLQAIMDKYQ